MTNIIQMAHFAMDWETLEISPGDATVAEIKEAYRQARAKQTRQAAMAADAHHRALCHKRGDHRAEIKKAAAASQAAWLEYYRANRRPIIED